MITRSNLLRMLAEMSEYAADLELQINATKKLREDDEDYIKGLMMENNTLRAKVKELEEQLDGMKYTE